MATSPAQATNILLLWDAMTDFENNLEGDEEPRTSQKGRNSRGTDGKQFRGRDWPLPPVLSAPKVVDTPRVLEIAIRVAGLPIHPELHAALLDFTREHSRPDQVKEFVTDLLRIVETSSRSRSADRGGKLPSAKSVPRPTPAAIRSARAAAKLTQTQAAQCIGVSMRTWQDWESGNRRMHPSMMELFKSKTQPE